MIGRPVRPRRAFDRRGGCSVRPPFGAAMGGLDRPNDGRRRINYIAGMNRDAILTELMELEGILQDDRLNDHDRLALHGAQQALRNIIEPDMWHPASQTFCRIDNRPSEAGSLLVH
jgi:hypothetical protein